MSKSFSFPNVGTCSRQTNIVLNDDHTIESIEVIGGCNGNLKGISRLLKGMKAEDAIARMEGTTCGPRPTSCPDQIAKNLKKGSGRHVTRTGETRSVVHCMAGRFFVGQRPLSLALLDSSPKGRANASSQFSSH